MARRRLGRGLDGLLPAVPPASERFAKNTAAIEDVHPGRMQPRGRMGAEGLAELAASIREHGVLEPILVRKRASGGFEIIAGERRWRAAQQAGLKEVPVFQHDLGDEAAFEAALVENLQREDLNPLETARAFQRLVDDYGYTQETIATKVGKERSTVANALRLLKLPQDVMELIEDGQLSEGHGRALLSAPSVSSMKKLARSAVSKGWSVREAERQARRLARGDGNGAAPKKAGKSTNVRDLELRLSRALGSTTKIHESGKERGQVRINYSSFDELDRILEKLTT
ncbi:MAG: ParB/RepB/Spo0J family partition protein [Polyangiales bacterium]